MAATLRELRGRIRSAGSIKKITKAQEMIATSRIGKAQARLEAARPYSDEITRDAHHARRRSRSGPSVAGRARPSRSGPACWWCRPTAVCAVRYNSSVFRRAEELFSLLREEGKTPIALHRRAAKR